MVHGSSFSTRAAPRVVVSPMLLMENCSAGDSSVGRSLRDLELFLDEWRRVQSVPVPRLLTAIDLAKRMRHSAKELAIRSLSRRLGMMKKDRLRLVIAVWERNSREEKYQCGKVATIASVRATPPPVTPPLVVKNESVGPQAGMSQQGVVPQVSGVMAKKVAPPALPLGPPVTVNKAAVPVIKNLLFDHKENGVRATDDTETNNKENIVKEINKNDHITNVMSVPMVSVPSVTSKKCAGPPLPVGQSAPLPVGKVAPPAFVGKQAPVDKSVLPVGKSAPPAFVGKLGGKSVAVPPIMGKSIPPPMGTPIAPPMGDSPLPVVVFPVPSIDTPSSQYEARRIHWPSIPASRFKNSIFGTKISCSGSPNIDFEMVKSHFVKFKQFDSPKRDKTDSISCTSPMTAAATPQMSRSPLGGPLVPKSVLDQKRIQQIEIFLNGNKFVNKTFLEDLLRGNTNTSISTSHVEILESILALYPTVEEIGLLSHSVGGGGQQVFPKSDAFLFDIAVAIPEFKTAANVRIVIDSFGDSELEISNYFQKFINLIDTLINSQSVVVALTVIGSIVVYLNSGSKTHGSGKAGAQFNGFSLEGLSQLKKITSFSSKEYSVIDCVVDLMTPGVTASLLLDLGQVAHSGVLEAEFGDVLLRTEELRKAVCDRISKVEFKNKEYHKQLIEEVIPKFLEKSVPLIEHLEIQKKEAIQKCSELQNYFAENDKRPPEEILGWLKFFASDLDKAAKKKRKIFSK